MTEPRQDPPGDYDWIETEEVRGLPGDFWPGVFLLVLALCAVLLLVVLA